MSSPFPRLLTVIVSYNRLELLQRTVESYRATVTLPHYLIVVDNGSEPDVVEWLLLGDFDAEIMLLGENMFPGYATNRGWELGLRQFDADLLHRSDNDFEYQPGWCEHVAERFAENDQLGQLGLRTLEEEGNVGAVGGCCVIRRELYDAGLRYDERPWGEIQFEDAHMSRNVLEMGWHWSRVTRPCATHIGVHDDSPYYQHTNRLRGLA